MITFDHDYVYDATMHRVIDGDTYELLIDLGFGIFATITVRLHGYNCLELGTPGGEAAAKFVRETITPAVQLRVETYKGPRSGKDVHSFARWIADVRVLPENRKLGDILVKQGLAVYL